MVVARQSVLLIDLGHEFGVDRSVFQTPGYRAPGVLLGIHQLTKALNLWNIYGNIILIIIQLLKGKKNTVS